ncbi:MAG: hypothetical protein GY799_20915 [Desulfobulbaceae bacterium]|nr:hypothetical protein [Desulfobulbaceae bacterium]
MNTQQWGVSRLSEDKEYLCVYDFDTPLFTAADALENKYIIATHKGTNHPLEFKNITTFWGRGNAVGGWLGDRNEARGTNLVKADFTIENKTRRNRAKVEKAKEKITKAITTVLEKPWCRELKLVIGGKDNYRKDIWPDYKANRGPKPMMYGELREWLEDEYKDLITVATGCEADDYLSIMMEWMRQECDGDFDKWDLVLVHRDKDMIQCGGYQWDWFKKPKFPLWIGEEKRWKNFWVQMMMGDSTDCIPGIPGVGLVGANKKLEGCDKSVDMEEKVLYAYEQHFTKKGEDWRKWFQINYQMLKLMEKKGVIPEYKFEGEAYDRVMVASAG